MCNERNHANCQPEDCSLFAGVRERAAATTSGEWEEQRVSFVYGTLRLEPDLMHVSREQVASILCELPGPIATGR